MPVETEAAVATEEAAQDVAPDEASTEGASRGRVARRGRARSPTHPRKRQPRRCPSRHRPPPNPPVAADAGTGSEADDDVVVVEHEASPGLEMAAEATAAPTAGTRDVDVRGGRQPGRGTDARGRRGGRDGSRCHRASRRRRTDGRHQADRGGSRTGRRQRPPAASPRLDTPPRPGDLVPTIDPRAGRLVKDAPRGGIPGVTAPPRGRAGARALPRCRTSIRRSRRRIARPAPDATATAAARFPSVSAASAAKRRSTCVGARGSRSASPHSPRPTAFRRRAAVHREEVLGALRAQGRRDRQGRSSPSTR